MITEPKIEDRNEQHYVGIRTQVTVQEMGPVLPPLWGEVYGWLASKGLKPAGAPLWRYRVVDMEAKMEIDMAYAGELDSISLESLSRHMEPGWRSFRQIDWSRVCDLGD
jgi:hypothetical protein